MHLRLASALLIGFSIGYLSFELQVSSGFTDLWLSYGSASYLLEGRNPYTYPNDGFATYPITTHLTMVPFVIAGIPLNVTGSIMIGSSSALLTWGMTRDGEWWRLLTFFSFPFWYSVLFVQWAPLMLAIMFLPFLVPLTIIKPHIGFPAGLLNFTWQRAVITAILLLGTFIIAPRWFTDWVTQARSYDGFIPLLTLPGALCAGILFGVLWQERRLRDRRWWYTFLVLTMPQRLWYDQLLLWYLPESRRQMFTLTLLSWLLVGPAFFMPLHPAFAPAQWWVGLLLYVPAAMFSMQRHNTEGTQCSGSIRMQEQEGYDLTPSSTTLS